jgi:hypothetical protein
VKSIKETVKSIFKDSLEYHLNSVEAVFKAFVAVVLIQFAALSLVSITNDVVDVPVLESVVSSAHFWWGLMGLYGAACLLFEKYIKGDKLVCVSGYLAAILSFLLLSFDFAASKPPIHTGGILAVTASVFLGGMLYGRIRK